MWCWPVARQPWSRWTAPGSSSGNNGGNLVLLDDRGQQMDSVTYAANEASAVDRFVRFRR